MGEWAIVQKGERVVVFECLEDGIWTDTNKNYDTSINLHEYVKAKYLEDYIKKKDYIIILREKGKYLEYQELNHKLKSLLIERKDQK